MYASPCLLFGDYLAQFDCYFQENKNDYTQQERLHVLYERQTASRINSHTHTHTHTQFEKRAEFKALRGRH